MRNQETVNRKSSPVSIFCSAKTGITKWYYYAILDMSTREIFLKTYCSFLFGTYHSWAVSFHCVSESVVCQAAAKMNAGKFLFLNSLWCMDVSWKVQNKFIFVWALVMATSLFWISLIVLLKFFLGGYCLPQTQTHSHFRLTFVKFK